MAAGEKKELGMRGEDDAALWLQRKGLQVLERNWRHGRHELDLIATDGRRLIFVEVKARSTERHGMPEEAVKYAKQQGMLEAGMAYAELRNHEGPVRFDVISIIYLPWGRQLQHFPDAFFPLGGN
ncbi:MAG: YraN family protein [Bacteroidetes bacterium]|nr:YraN family protein [Bacteroidota bacterium]